MRADRPALLLLCALLACGGDPAPERPEGGGPDVAMGGPPPSGGPQHDQGQRSPPLPADNPVWEWNAGGFVSDFGWYGEKSWDDVRMRVAGHLGVIGRDRARLAATQGHLAGAAAAYGALAEALAAFPPPKPGPAAEIHSLLLSAARRDAALCAALARGEAPPTTEGLAGLRARVVALALQEAPDAAEARATREALKAYLTLDPQLNLDDFKDFDDRHKLRVRLFAAALDAVDPLGMTDPWGYWEATERRRQALALYAAAGALAGLPEAADDAALLKEHLSGAMPDLSALPRLRWPSAIASAWTTPSPGFTAEGLGGLPTGDTLIDVAAQPGPRAIGSLSRLGLDDPDHRAALEAEAQALNAALAAQPDAVLTRLQAWVTRLDAYGHGSRYYNIKQARNEAVRRLAEAGHPRLALAPLRESWPLHHQDWACPNREGILRAVEARLLALAGDPGAADALQVAWTASLDFLKQVDAAEAAGPGAGLKPPSPGPMLKGGGSVGPPGPPPGGSTPRSPHTPPPGRP
ncbi:hypothetical protein L6R49_29790 [Myxococcota bacterium]|nr:hypothetical protein [Myxococcota bacterium]